MEINHGSEASREEVGRGGVIVTSGATTPMFARYTAVPVRARSLWVVVCVLGNIGTVEAARQETGMTDLGSLTDQDLVNEWARLVLPAAGGVHPGRGSFGGHLDLGELKAVTEELERRGYSEQPGGYFESKNPDVPQLRPEVS